ncbi:MAG TPA: hypothetical protein PKA58_37360, partial [Polyangium sp.]|nr:hypothetical protein [Polyangium sp.]
FFADDDALRNSGTTFHPPQCSRQGLDPERFRVCCDEPFFDENLGECFKGFDSLRNEPIRHSKRKESNCPWSGQGREFHPKKYLCYLCRRDSPFEFCTSYSETGDTQSFGGIATLQSLDWAKVFVGDSCAPYLRALVEDLEDALGMRPALTNWPQSPTSFALTARYQASIRRVLRNV